jgi:hypothetical protein
MTQAPHWHEAQAYARTLPRVAVTDRREIDYEVDGCAYRGVVEYLSCGHLETNGRLRPAKWRRCWQCGRMRKAEQEGGR